MPNIPTIFLSAYFNFQTIGFDRRVIRPPDRAPLFAAVYFTGSTASIDARNAVHKEIGALIAETF